MKFGLFAKNKGNKRSEKPIFYNKTAIEGKMDLPRNRLHHARHDIRPNDITIVRLLRLQTSIFQKRIEKVDKNIQIMTEKTFSENPKKRQLPIFSVTTTQTYNPRVNQGKTLFHAPKTQTISIHYELLWCLVCIFILCLVPIIILRVL